MKKFSKWIILFLMVVLISCQKSSEQGTIEEAVLTNEWLPKEETYQHEDITVSLSERTVRELLRDHHFESDSVYKVYENQLSRNRYFVLTLRPDHGQASQVPLNTEQLGERTCLVSCGDTTSLTELSLLHDFGLSKEKQVLLVFSSGLRERNKECDETCVLVRGLFNRFDKYEFEIAKD